MCAYYRSLAKIRPPPYVDITNSLHRTHHHTSHHHTYTLTSHTQLSGSTQRPLKVSQYHFTAWPDHGVPDYATSILAFHRRVKSQHVPSKGPLLVHCRLVPVCVCRSLPHSCIHYLTHTPSAGVGRTGTYMAIDSVLEQVERDQLVDIPAVITAMRRQRMHMVQTPVS